MPKPIQPRGGSTPLSVLTPYQAHVKDWGSCTRCHLHLTRKKVCLARGSIPADVLFAGEAPGNSEDVIGQPMVGPAGRLMDYIIGQSMTWEDSLDPSGKPREERKPLWTFCISNMVGCLPVDETGRKASEPSIEEIEACAPRLFQLCGIVKPRLIVAVGTYARDWLDPKVKKRVELPPLHGSKPPRPIPQVFISHPAALLRANTAVQGLGVQRAIVTIRTAIEKHVLGGNK